MPLYTLTSSSIDPIAETNFGSAGVRERADLQRLLKQKVSIVSPDTLIIAEEFGSWDASFRRIDLLGIDRDAKLVVIELKRDETGSHMDLQALRYAAMVARMTFDQAASVYQAYLTQNHSSEDARSSLLQFLDWEEPDETSFAQDVRIVLVAADFSRELTTSVMWLNERELDIRCWQLKPYQLGEQLLLSVEQVLPLPEARDYQIQVREKARRERESGGGGADFTRYDLTIGGQTHGPLWKRRMIYQAVRHVIERFGQTPEDIAALVKHGRLWAVLDGDHDSDSFRAEITKQSAAGGPKIDPRRFLSADEELIKANGRTYAFTKAWGTNTMPALEALKTAFPQAGISYQPRNDG